MLQNCVRKINAMIVKAENLVSSKKTITKQLLAIVKVAFEV